MGAVDTWNAVAVALTFVWLGMVLGISFLEAPLKFRVPGVTLAVGLSIGRAVFRVLNRIELLLAVAIAGCLLAGTPPVGAAVLLGLAVVALLFQLAVVRPVLARHSDRVLAGAEEGPRSHSHLWYVVTELLKAVALAAGGALLLS